MTTAERKQFGAKGGSVTAAQSTAKAAALRALHASRRGKRQHPDTRERETVLGEALALLRTPMRGVVSIRVLAEHCRVSDRTVRRWLSGEDWPPPTALRRIAEWARRHRP